ncbi:MAG: glucose-1-phosphate cytidylyltransferase [Candidatus Omnitrophica bacterium]|nr:glucose-1-phosphate cytidylyltransferase [Candidatus Omnitrophota bacterium]MDD5352378.1 glucose-1-phosphate cytidylyltransferase [Candidatus Omnitrophota bacterium]MDD5549976.1 glucose-1-phosphate cytidylyltransferase [Candidatus Omnitrophota bacterium]
MKVVILCGGRGTRLKEETEFKPKPMVEIGGKPILWHIMKIYSSYGFNDFVLCLGYKGEMIKEYFLNYEAMNNDFTIRLDEKDRIKFHSKHPETNWKIALVDTGLNSNTGARIKRIEKYIDGDLFMMTYGDGVANINIKDLFSFHKSQKRLSTVTGVHPSSRFGELIIKGKRVIKFSEKPRTSQGFINGGFFVFNRKVFKYLNNKEGCDLERDVLEKIAAKGQLSVYIHEGFWQCMDTQRELDLLTNLWAESKAPWKVW